MRRMTFCVVAFFSFFLIQIGGPLCARAADGSESQASHSSSPGAAAGKQAGQKGGIYVVGRGFKTAGHEMKEGFKAAGRGIEKGGKATGHAFKKAGHSIKNFFTGEKDEPKKEEPKKEGH